MPSTYAHDAAQLLYQRGQIAAEQARGQAERSNRLIGSLAQIGSGIVEQIPAMQKAKAAEDDAKAIKASFAKFQTPNGPDWDAVIADLYPRRPSAASALEKHVGDMRKSRFETLKLQHENDASEAKWLAGNANMLLDDPTLFPVVKDRMTKLYPGSEKLLGDTFDKTRVNAIADNMLTSAEKETRRAALVGEAHQKLVDDRGKPDFIVNSTRDLASYALLGDASEYPNVLAHASDFGYPAEAVAAMPKTFDEARLRQMTIPVVKQEELAGQQEDRDIRSGKTGAGTEAQMDARFQELQAKINLKTPLTPAEKADYDAFKQRKTLVPAATFIMGAPARADAASARTDARLDRSYQANKSSLDKMRQPLADQATRMDRLVETVNAATPQADALVAPELLTVMAGGQGSGLRMNEAEIARIVGGRSHLESITAALHKWELDPTKALSITAEQRREIKSLIAAVRTKSAARLQIVDSAADQLLDADTVEAHRRIITDTQKKLDTLSGAGPNGAPEQRPIPGIPGGIAELRNGKWIRIK